MRRYVKPHGALYHRVTDDEEQADAVLAGSGDTAVLGFPGSHLLALAAAAGRATYEEGFPDRGYADGRLIERGRPGALVDDADAIVAQAVRLAADGRVAVRARGLAGRGGARLGRTPGVPGGVVRRGAVPGLTASSTASGRICGGAGAFCGGNGPLCGGHAEGRK